MDRSAARCLAGPSPSWVIFRIILLKTAGKYLVKVCSETAPAARMVLGLTFFSFIGHFSWLPTNFGEGHLIITWKGGSWVNVKNDWSWPAAENNLEITEIQSHLETTDSSLLNPPATSRRAQNTQRFSKYPFVVLIDHFSFYKSTVHCFTVSKN